MTDRTRPLVVIGVDGSAGATQAARWAAAAMADRRPSLRLLHVSDVPVPRWLCDLATELGPDTAVSQVPFPDRRGAGGRPAPESTEAGVRAAIAIADAATDADLAVVGSYGAGAGGGVQVGSTALALLDLATCPVAVVRGARRGDPPPEHGPVVVGFDGSASSVAALALGARLAEAAGAPLVVAHTWSEVAADARRGLYRQLDRWDELANEARVMVDKGVDEMRDRHPGLMVRPHVVGDTPLRDLLDVAVTARMVVVGRRGLRPASITRLGSTSRGLVEFAPCPVVVAPPERTADETAGNPAATSVRSM